MLNGCIYTKIFLEIGLRKGINDPCFELNSYSIIKIDSLLEYPYHIY